MMEFASTRCCHDLRFQDCGDLLPMRQVAVKVLRSSIDDAEAEAKMVKVKIFLLSHMRCHHIDTHLH